MKQHVVSLTLLIAFLFCATLNAQTQLPKSNKFNISTGIGILPTFVKDKGTYSVPPLSIHAGLAVSKKFHLNGYLGYVSATSNPRLFADGLVTQVQNKSIIAGLRSEMHHEVTKKLEIYGGALIGYNSANMTEYDANNGQKIERVTDQPTPYDPNAPKGQIIYSGFVGTTLMLQKNMGVFAEVGYGISLLSTGLTFKL